MTVVLASWCDRCGGALAGGDHAACVDARRLEPPRYCGACRRRMKVQVVPTGWAATCVEHGTLRSGGAGGDEDGRTVAR